MGSTSNKGGGVKSFSPSEEEQEDSREEFQNRKWVLIS